MRITVVGMPCSERIARRLALAEAAHARRRKSGSSQARWREYAPVRLRGFGHRGERPRVGGSRWTKSKMPCRRVHAGDEGGPRHRALRRRGGGEAREFALRRSRSRFGRSSQWRSTKSGSMPSMPSTMTRLVAAPCGRSGSEDDRRGRAAQDQAASMQGASHAASLIDGRAVHPCAARATPNRSSTVGAISSMPGSRGSILRFRTARRAPAAGPRNDRRSRLLDCLRSRRAVTLPTARVPGGPVAFVVADDEIGRGVQVRAAIERSRWRKPVRMARRARSSSRSPESLSISSRFSASASARVPRCPALRGPRMVQIQAAQPERVGARAAPVHVLK